MESISSDSIPALGRWIEMLTNIGLLHDDRRAQFGPSTHAGRYPRSRRRRSPVVEQPLRKRLAGSSSLPVGSTFNLGPGSCSEPPSPTTALQRASLVWGRWTPDPRLGPYSRG